MLQHCHVSPFFPYTTLFRSERRARRCAKISTTDSASSASRSRRSAIDGATSHSLSTAICVVARNRSEEHTSELQSRLNIVCRLPLEQKNILRYTNPCSWSIT